MAFIASHLTSKEEKKDLEKIFKLMDKDGVLHRNRYENMRELRHHAGWVRCRHSCARRRERPLWRAGPIAAILARGGRAAEPDPHPTEQNVGTRL